MEKTKSKKIRKLLLICVAVIGALAILGGVALLSVDAYVRLSTQDRILTQEQAAQLADVDCIVVLGCLVHDDGTPSHMLEDRLKRGVALYQQGAAPKLLMSGDHGTVSYDEVNAMKQYAVNAGVSSEDVFMDHAGFSTYETVYRAKAIFGADKIIIVSQQYHLYRALHVADALGIDAYGVSSDYRSYAGQAVRDVREILARGKDFVLGIFKPEPTYLGEMIPISGNGELTHDENSNFH